jgi:hypothetical protein
MQRSMLMTTLVIVLGFAASAAGASQEEGWITLFDGKTFGDWKPNERPDSWSIQDGAIVARGPRSHLFYMPRGFKNFDFKADVMTKPGSNSGIFFHTKYVPEGWPKQGYECQVNNTHGDTVKTGSLYDTKKIYKTAAQDNKWWTQEIIVRGKRVVVKVDGKTVLDYTEPEGKTGTLKLGKGLFALQAHDPKSEVRFKNIKIRPLP